MADDIPPMSAGRLEKTASHLRADQCDALRLGAVLQLASGEVAARFGMSTVAAEALIAGAC